MGCGIFNWERAGIHWGPVRVISKGFLQPVAPLLFPQHHRAGRAWGAQRGFIRAFMAIGGGAGLRGDGSGVEAGDGDGNHTGTRGVCTPGRSCLFEYLRRDVRTTASGGGKAGALSHRNRYSYLFLEAKILPVPQAPWQP